MSADTLVLLALALADALFHQAGVPLSVVCQRFKMLAATAPPEAAGVFRRAASALEAADPARDPRWLAKVAGQMKQED